MTDIPQRFARQFDLIARAKLFVRADDAVDDKGLFGVEMRDQFQMGVEDNIKWGLIRQYS